MPNTPHEAAAAALAANVMSRAEKGGFALTSEIHREALGLVRRLAKSGRTPQALLSEFMIGFRAILQKYEPILARTISDAQLAAFLQGGRGITQSIPGLGPPMSLYERLQHGGPPEPPDWARQMSMPWEPKPVVRFKIIEEAAADLAGRELMTSQGFHEAAAMGRVNGFMVSRIASLDALEKVRDSLVDAVVEGHSLRTWGEKVAEAIEGSGLSPGRQAMLFRDTIMTSYSRGQKAVAEHPQVQSVATFVIRSEIDDSRLTALCRVLSHSGLDGTAIYCTADPTWRRVSPPSHHNCRCNSVFIDLERAATRYGIKIAQQWLESGQRPSPEELFVPMPDLSGVPESERRQFESWQSAWAA